jgi:PadR family transcriptional regulator, regulatory protein PadR
MRITGPLMKVLRALMEAFRQHEKTYGLELSRETGLKGGTLYPILDRLEAEGWVQAEWEDVDPSEAGRPRRRLYVLSGHGAHEAYLVLEDHGVHVPGYVPNLGVSGT